ncbi:MAG TPA: amidohydrolase family protein [Candidatus Acidoferrales bacterium]|nr:amidohydrolase family protein [Candidatus Acidoferrales bacterium]
MLALTGGTVIDGDRITAIGGPAPAGATSVDVRGRTILPGLIDAHVHLCSYAGTGNAPPHWSLTTFDEEQLLHGAANARKALLAGFTTVRDMAGARPEIALKHASDAFVLEGARVVSAGFVGMTGGHGDLFAPPASDKRPFPVADGVDACRTAVRRHARDGADLIKICTSGGVLSMGDKSEWRNYTDEETRTIVDEAHALGMRVAAHAHTKSGIAQALDAGVDSVEHGSQLDERLAERMAKSGTRLVATLAIHEQIRTRGKERGVSAESLAKADALHESRLRAVRVAKTAGVRILCGTDSSNVLPFGLHAWELELLCAEGGFTAMEALVAATRDAAEAVGLADRTGTLEAGKWADVIVVDGDPLKDITVLRDAERIRNVFREGRLLVDRG